MSSALQPKAMAGVALKARGHTAQPFVATFLGGVLASPLAPGHGPYGIAKLFRLSRAAPIAIPAVTASHVWHRRLCACARPPHRFLSFPLINVPWGTGQVPSAP